MSHNITHRIKRGSFIEYSLSGIKRSSFKVIKRELSSVLKNKKGIYALYDGKKLVRVGLATNIYWRVKGHSKNEKINAFLKEHQKKRKEAEKMIDKFILKSEAPRGKTSWHP